MSIETGHRVQRITDPGIGTNQDRWTGTVKHINGQMVRVESITWCDVDGGEHPLPDTDIHRDLLRVQRE